MGNPTRITEIKGKKIHTKNCTASMTQSRCPSAHFKLNFKGPICG